MYRTNSLWFPQLHLDGEGDPSGQGAAPKMKIKYNDAEIEIDRPAGYFTQEEIAKTHVPVASHNDQMARMRKQVDAVKDRKSMDELLADPEFKTKAIESWGISPNANAKELQTQIERKTLELTEREIKPRESKIGALTQTVGTLRQKDLRGQIAQAAVGLKIDEKFMRSPTKGGTPLIVAMLEGSFGFDDEHGEWFAKGADGKTFAFSQSGEVPYQTVAEFMAGWAQAEGKDFLRSERQSGAGADTKGKDGESIPGQHGKEIRLTEAQVRDIPYFRKMLAKAEKDGLTIVMV